MMLNYSFEAARWHFECHWSAALKDRSENLTRFLKQKQLLLISLLSVYSCFGLNFLTGFEALTCKKKKQEKEKKITR